MTNWQAPTMQEIEFEGESIVNWKFIGDTRYRIYYKPNEGNDSDNLYGFKFCVVEIFSIRGDGEVWDDDCEVEYLFNGWAAFDGVRHLNLRTERDEIFGYMNYPDLTMLAEILLKLRELELKYCRDPYYDK